MTAAAPGRQRHRTRCANGPAIVAEHYYALAAKAIHAADPDALYFGDRLPIYYDPAAVRAEAPHVDAIATNYNVDSQRRLDRALFLRRAARSCRAASRCWSPNGSSPRDENRTGNRNNGHLMTVETQAERAPRRRRGDRRISPRSREIVGAHWFQYYDHPKGGRADGEDYDFGLVDIDDRPYQAADRGAGRGQPRARRRSTRPPPAEPARPAATSRVPHAAIALARPLAGRLAEAGEPAAAADARRRARSISARPI